MARRTSPVPDWIPADLPPAPGVYHFVDAADTSIYIGKSVNLRRRVRGYFYGGGPGDERKRELLRLARGLRYRRCGTDLEAQLDEAESIAALRPAFNRVHKNRSRGWYIEADWSRPFPRLRVVQEPRRARAEYIGPYRGRRIPSEAVALVEKIYRLRTCAGSIAPDENGSPCLQYGIDQCSGPCVGLATLDAYRGQVRNAVSALTDDRAASRHERALKRHIDTLATSRPASTTEIPLGLRRRLEWFEDLASYRPALHRLPVDRSRLIVLPAAIDDRWILVPIARGRVLPRVEVRRDKADWPSGVEDACYRIRVAELRAEAAFPAEALTLTLIVSRWLSARRKSTQDPATTSATPGCHVFELDEVADGEVLEKLSRAGVTD